MPTARKTCTERTLLIERGDEDPDKIKVVGLFKLPCDGPDAAGYWAVKATEETAIHGVWKKGPGKDLFDVLEKVKPSF